MCRLGIVMVVRFGGEWGCNLVCVFFIRYFYVRITGCLVFKRGID